MHGVRADDDRRDFLDERPQIDATFVTADDRAFRSMQLELTEAELQRLDQELPIGVDADFLSEPLRSAGWFPAWLGSTTWSGLGLNSSGLPSLKSRSAHALSLHCASRGRLRNGRRGGALLVNGIE